ncbi:hypothetical protein M427DRAFT_115543 [Gonapodya prolifera JEL478]|uniref:Uncharacterized protein n=1 Tax=Gonapodya prolifera (strain JEL478) TaxID=1344416 RepID=A0A139A1W5_GONPJ|nr:hypothetical protein M427DRAFT_115543 [Gonapodya prolifera JEL478]|eukprot:KXS10767.1 hypothetical protein M427DRAFT_115543 [Gonapodya prolifera JEL478]
MLSAYLALLSSYPILTKSTTSAILAACGDLLAQVLENWNASRSISLGEDGRSSSRRQCSFPFTFTFVRTLRLASYGFFVAAPMSHFWYIILDHLVGHGTDISVALAKVAIDQILMAPFSVNLFFTYQGLLQGWTARRIRATLARDVWPTLVTSWAVWPIVQMVSFMFVPADLRVLWVNVIGLGWNTYLSLVQQRATENDPVDHIELEIVEHTDVKEDSDIKVVVVVPTLAEMIDKLRVVTNR